MSDPRMIPADEAQVTLDAVNHAGGYGYSFLDTYVRDLAHTVIEQAAQIERVREDLKALRDYYIDREARSRERLESVTDEREQSHLARFAHMHKRTHEALTRTLEAAADHVDETLGDTDDTKH